MANKEDIDFYDVIIDIDSFQDLKSKGWEIKMTEEGQKKYNFFSNQQQNKKENIELNRIGILGVSGVGKSFILGKLIDNKDLKENNIETKGISVIYPEVNSKQLFVCLDSQGSEEPIISKNKTYEEILNLTYEERKKLIKESSKDKKFIELFIQDFIIEKSNILIVVVNLLTFSEQKLINRLKNTDYDKIFVIHNLQFFTNIDTIMEHIKNVVEKSLFSNLQRRNIPNLDQNQNNDETSNSLKPFYFKEIDIGISQNANNSNQQKEILHLFMGREGSDAGNYFNHHTINYIKHLLLERTNKKIFNIIDELKKSLVFNSNQYMIKTEKKSPITSDDLEIDESDGTFLKCKNDFQLKDCIINEMGESNFSTENSINPSYICFKGEYVKKKKNDIIEKWPALVIKTEMFEDPNNIDIKTNKSDDNEYMYINISCKREFEKEPNIDIIQNIEGGDIKEGNIVIEIKFKLEDFVLESELQPIIKENANYPGIKEIYLKIVDNNNVQDLSSIKTETIKKGKGKKKEGENK